MNIGTRTLNPTRKTTTWPSLNLRGALMNLIRPVRSEFAQTKLRLESTPLLRLHIEGDLNRHTALAFKKIVQDVLTRPAKRWQIDLSQIRRWDADGVALLVHALDVSEMNGRELQLLTPPQPLRAIIEKAQLHRIFWITDEG